MQIYPTAKNVENTNKKEQHNLMRCSFFVSIKIVSKYYFKTFCQASPQTQLLAFRGSFC